LHRCTSFLPIPCTDFIVNDDEADNMAFTFVWTDDGVAQITDQSILHKSWHFQVHLNIWHLTIKPVSMYDGK